jgi:methylated-DNA-protein-cysteine methyltransferase-like protein
MPNVAAAALPDWREAVYVVVRSIPEGTVATYGQVADMVTGVTVTARQVGSALRFAPKDVPWHRVVGAGGRFPIGKQSPYLSKLQLDLLIDEGVRCRGGTPSVIDMAVSQWKPASALYDSAQEAENTLDA